MFEKIGRHEFLLFSCQPIYSNITVDFQDLPTPSQRNIVRLYLNLDLLISLNDHFWTLLIQKFTPFNKIWSIPKISILNFLNKYSRLIYVFIIVSSKFLGCEKNVKRI